MLMNYPLSHSGAQEVNDRIVNFDVKPKANLRKTSTMKFKIRKGVKVMVL